MGQRSSIVSPVKTVLAENPKGKGKKAVGPLVARQSVQVIGPFGGLLTGESAMKHEQHDYHVFTYKHYRYERFLARERAVEKRLEQLALWYDTYTTPEETEAEMDKVKEKMAGWDKHKLAKTPHPKAPPYQIRGLIRRYGQAFGGIIGCSQSNRASGEIEV